MGKKNLKNLTPDERFDALLKDISLAKEFSQFDFWEDIDYDQWFILLEQYPQFADYCYCWDTFWTNEWAKLLSKRPYFADRCAIFKEFSPEDCITLLNKQPQFADKFDWDNVASQLYSLHLAKCEHGLLNDWKNILLSYPKLSKYFPLKLWLIFTPLHWKDILSKYPQFIEKAKETHAGWVAILQKQPELIDKYDKWDNLEFSHWCELLSIQPQFEKFCDWKKVIDKDIFSITPETDYILHINSLYYNTYATLTLLRTQPQFADKIPDIIYDNFSNEQWEELETNNIDTFKQKHLLSTLRKLSKDR